MNHSDQDIERLVADSLSDGEPDPQHREVLRERVLAAYDESQSAASVAAQVSLVHSFWRWSMVRPVVRLGVPSFLFAVGVACVLALLPANRGIAMEKLIEPLISAKSGRCQIVVQMKDKKLPPFTFESMFRDALHRQENKEMGMVMIMDGEKGIIVSLSPNEKKAHILEQVNRAPDQKMEGGFLQQMREMLLGLKDDKRITERVSLGEREIADGVLIGYRLISPGGEVDIWGKRDTGLPHSVISNAAAFPSMEITMTDFEFDVDLDDSLFSLTPPEGYTVTRETMDMSLRSEEGFIAALRQYAEVNGGVYPDTINAMEGIKISAEYGKQLPELSGDKREKEVNRVRKLLAAGFAFPLQLPAEANAVYAGKGVPRGDSDKPIFWYRPEQADRCRVVFADLSVVDAEEPPRPDDAQVFAKERE